jgi:hypothetical protein
VWMGRNVASRAMVARALQCRVIMATSGAIARCKMPKAAGWVNKGPA